MHKQLGWISKIVNFVCSDEVMIGQVWHKAQPDADNPFNKPNEISFTILDITAGYVKFRVVNGSLSYVTSARIEWLKTCARKVS
jgi:hypothetical protein